MPRRDRGGSSLRRHVWRRLRLPFERPPDPLRRRSGTALARPDGAAWPVPSVAGAIRQSRGGIRRAIPRLGGPLRHVGRRRSLVLVRRGAVSRRGPLRADRGCGPGGGGVARGRSRIGAPGGHDVDRRLPAPAARRPRHESPVRRPGAVRPGDHVRAPWRRPPPERPRSVLRAHVPSSSCAFGSREWFHLARPVPGLGGRLRQGESGGEAERSGSIVLYSSSSVATVDRRIRRCASPHLGGACRSPSAHGGDLWAQGGRATRGGRPVLDQSAPAVGRGCGGTE